jgi:hypothetical protein
MRTMQRFPRLDSLPSGRIHHFLDFFTVPPWGYRRLFSWKACNRAHKRSASCRPSVFTSFAFLWGSLASAFLVDTFLDSGQFLFQLVPVVLQAFPLLLRREESAEARTASAPATTTGASSQYTGSWSHTCLTHRCQLFPGFLVSSNQGNLADLRLSQLPRFLLTRSKDKQPCSSNQCGETVHT